MPLFNEDVCDPVIAMMAYNTINEAILLANDSPFGLGGAIFTGKLEAKEKNYKKNFRFCLMTSILKK